MYICNDHRMLCFFPLSLQVGHVTLFMCDQYGNYLALSVDSKTYYLNADCVSKLKDVAPLIPQINLKRYALFLCELTQSRKVEFISTLYGTR